MSPRFLNLSKDAQDTSGLEKSLNIENCSKKERGDNIMVMIRVLEVTRKGKGEGYIIKSTHGTGIGAKIPMPPTLHSDDLGPGVANILDGMVEERKGGAKQGWEVNYEVKKGKHYFTNPVRR